MLIFLEKKEFRHLLASALPLPDVPHKNSSQTWGAHSNPISFYVNAPQDYQISSGEGHHHLLLQIWNHNLKIISIIASYMPQKQIILLPFSFPSEVEFPRAAGTEAAVKMDEGVHGASYLTQ